MHSLGTLSPSVLRSAHPEVLAAVGGQNVCGCLLGSAVQHRTGATAIHCKCKPRIGPTIGDFVWQRLRDSVKPHRKRDERTHCAAVTDRGSSCNTLRPKTYSAHRTRSFSPFCLNNGRSPETDRNDANMLSACCTAHSAHINMVNQGSKHATNAIMPRSPSITHMLTILQLGSKVPHSKDLSFKKKKSTSKIHVQKRDGNDAQWC